MIRPWHTWVIFSTCLAVVLAAMGWISLAALRLDQAEAQARQQAQIEESVRLSLWRMDSALAPLIGQESARPYFFYSSFYPLERAYTRMFAEIRRGEVLLPSPLLDPALPYVLLHFQVGPDGVFSSPQVPTGNMRQLAEGGYTTLAKIEMAAKRLAELRSMVNRDALAALVTPLPPQTQPAHLAMLPQDAGGTTAPPGAQPQPTRWAMLPQNAPRPSTQPATTRPARTQVQQTAQFPGQQGAQVLVQQQLNYRPRSQGDQDGQQQDANRFGQHFDMPQRAQRQTDQINLKQATNRLQPSPDQQDMNTNEFNARSFSLTNNDTVFFNGGSNIAGNGVIVNYRGNTQVSNGAVANYIYTTSLEASASNVNEGLAQAIWIGDVLLLVRWVSVNGDSYLQGCQLDWPAIRVWLVGEVKDLLPACHLVPVHGPAEPDSEGRMLAALPVVRLIAGPIPTDPAEPVSLIRISLVVAWGCVLLAAGAVAVLLVGTVSLSERRAAFVSAVTHEMRTPLTTFRMYTEMLVKGMVPDEDKRRRYLETLRAEADRLTHLVGNVLAYARLERNHDAEPSETVTLKQLLDAVQHRLADRVIQAGMDLQVRQIDDVPPTTLQINTSAVEQILFNLVDNSCKYAADGSERCILIAAAPRGRRVVIKVQDHGPGIPPDVARHLFRPFSKSAHDAANSAPGVGLGLALSRRLARHIGGNLYLDRKVKEGTCFVLTLPARTSGACPRPAADQSPASCEPVPPRPCPPVS